MAGYGIAWGTRRKIRGIKRSQNRGRICENTDEHTDARLWGTGGALAHKNRQKVANYGKNRNRLNL